MAATAKPRPEASDSTIHAKRSIPALSITGPLQAAVQHCHRNKHNASEKHPPRLPLTGGTAVPVGIRAPQCQTGCLCPVATGEEIHKFTLKNISCKAQAADALTAPLFATSQTRASLCRVLVVACCCLLLLFIRPVNSKLISATRHDNFPDLAALGFDLPQRGKILIALNLKPAREVRIFNELWRLLHVTIPEASGTYARSLELRPFPSARPTQEALAAVAPVLASEPSTKQSCQPRRVRDCGGTMGTRNPALSSEAC